MPLQQILSFWPNAQKGIGHRLPDKLVYILEQSSRSQRNLLLINCKPASLFADTFLVRLLLSHYHLMENRQLARQ